MKRDRLRYCLERRRMLSDLRAELTDISIEIAEILSNGNQNQEGLITC